MVEAWGQFRCVPSLIFEDNENKVTYIASKKKKKVRHSISNGEPWHDFKQNHPVRSRYWMMFLAAKWKMQGQGQGRGLRLEPEYLVRR